jgi:Tfp pilus assembly protein PilF
MLQQAYAMLQAGDAATAEAKVRLLLGARTLHPDALHLLALTLTPQNRAAEARTALEAALKLAPHHAQILNSHGNLLSDMDEPDAALRSFEQALKADPAYAEAWINLGITATTVGKTDAGIKALEHATLLAPEAARAWSALGFALQQQGETDAALAPLRRALQLDPQDVRARHNLGTALRSTEAAAAAVEQFDLAIAGGLAGPEVRCMRAHALADLGRFDEAIGHYEAVLRDAPDYLEAHDTLAHLLPQLGQQPRALDSYHRALEALPNAKPLWQSALRAASDMKDQAQVLRWAAAATKVLGPQIEFEIAEARALVHLGEDGAAQDRLQTLLVRHPEMAALHTILTHVLLRTGDIEAAQHHALRATELAPFDQSGWAYLTLIWRLRDDPREAWLARYDQLVMPLDLALPDAVLAELDTTLTDLHLLLQPPAEQSLRGGTQTRGNILDRRAPVLQMLMQTIKQRVQAALALLPEDSSHPFLRRKTSAIAFSGSWSVRLGSAGFHINHMHPRGWISSAFYVSLPKEIRGTQAGALTFGVPDATLGLDLPPRRVEIPTPGKLVIFPSYLWHGTLPFAGEAPRLTVAFDALPA